MLFNPRFLKNANLIKLVPSMAPEDIRCSPLTSMSLQVSWQPPPEVHQNGIVQGYKINYEPFNDLSGNIILTSTTAF
jgi:hypothetical protein